MNWIEDNQPLSEGDLEEVRQEAHEEIEFRRRRTVTCAAVFVLACACLYPFFAGHFLHRYWDSVGKYLLLVTLGIFFALVYCASEIWVAWQALRDVEKDNGAE